MEIQKAFGMKESISEKNLNLIFVSFLFSIVQAEIVSIRENNGVYEFYIHYTNFNRRLDEWVTIEKMNLKELTPPSSSSSSSLSNHISQEMPIIQPNRTVLPSTTTKNTSASNEISSGNTTTTFFLSDDADSLNNDLSRSETLPQLTNHSTVTSTTITPTKARGNGNIHHSGAHSVTKVKNINLIHLGRYFIKPWYFSPYPEVRSLFFGRLTRPLTLTSLSGIYDMSSCLHM